MINSLIQMNNINNLDNNNINGLINQIDNNNNISKEIKDLWIPLLLKKRNKNLITNRDNKRLSEHLRILGRIKFLIELYNIHENKDESDHKETYKFSNSKVFTIKNANRRDRYELYASNFERNETYHLTFYFYENKTIINVEYKHKETSIVDKRHYHYKIEYDEKKGRLINNPKFFIITNNMQETFIPIPL